MLCAIHIRKKSSVYVAVFSRQCNVTHKTAQDTQNDDCDEWLWLIKYILDLLCMRLWGVNRSEHKIKKKTTTAKTDFQHIQTFREFIVYIVIKYYCIFYVFAFTKRERARAKKRNVEEKMKKKNVDTEPSTDTNSRPKSLIWEIINKMKMNKSGSHKHPAKSKNREETIRKWNVLVTV